MVSYHEPGPTVWSDLFRKRSLPDFYRAAWGDRGDVEHPNISLLPDAKSLSSSFADTGREHFERHAAHQRRYVHFTMSSRMIWRKPKRGMFNEPRNAAVYLVRKIRRDCLKEIGELFEIGKYSSVSSMIEGTKQRMKTDRSFRKRINDLYHSIINSQKQTWPLFNLVFSAWSALVWWYLQSVKNGFESWWIEISGYKSIRFWSEFIWYHRFWKNWDTLIVSA